MNKSSVFGELIFSKFALLVYYKIIVNLKNIFNLKKIYSDKIIAFKFIAKMIV